MKIQSYLVHEEAYKSSTKAHVLPLNLSSSFEFESIDQGIDIFNGVEKGHVYSRYGNPTVEAVASKIAALESFGLDVEAFAIMVSSGMSAISTLCLAELSPGDILITQQDLYGGSTELFKKVLSKFGIEVLMIDLSNKQNLEKQLLRPRVKMLYCESPSNPTLSCLDLHYLSTICKKSEVLTAIDNTFCTPYIQQPFLYDFDYSIHSTTKYLNGHGNSIAGIIVGQNLNKYELILDSMKLIGTNCSPFEAWLVNNGLKTLSLRMQKHSENALELAKRLSSHKLVKQVNYPHLQSDVNYKLAIRQMKFGGGMLSFELNGGMEKAISFMNKLKFCKLAPTLGDVDSLVLHPATMSHRNIEKTTRQQSGISDGLIRLSVGIEDVDDIYNDIEQAI